MAIDADEVMADGRATGKWEDLGVREGDKIVAHLVQDSAKLAVGAMSKIASQGKGDGEEHHRLSLARHDRGDEVGWGLRLSEGGDEEGLTPVDEYLRYTLELLRTRERGDGGLTESEVAMQAAVERTTDTTIKRQAIAAGNDQRLGEDRDDEVVEWCAHSW